MRAFVSSLVPAWLRAVEKKKSWRIPLLLLGLTVFMGGSIWSIDRLELEPSSLALGPLFVLLFVLAPISLVYSGVNMWLTAKAAKIDLSLGMSMQVAAFAQTAEVLPLPGGAIVRTAALVREGAGTGQSASQVLASAILWISCAAAAAGIAVKALGWPAWVLAAAGIAGVLGAMGWIAYFAGAKIAVASGLFRMIGIPLAALRLYFAFAALNLGMEFFDTFLFTFASIAGAASSIAPAGLGVSEGLAAVLATMVAVSPATAFLGVGLDRFVGLMTSSVASLYYVFANSR